MSKFTAMGCAVAAMEIALGVWQLLEKDFIVAICCFVFAIVSFTLIMLVKRSYP